jgi:cytochrome oxidase Cu insertion factor (SCO1/SenC/PrrC family)
VFISTSWNYYSSDCPFSVVDAIPLTAIIYYQRRWKMISSGVKAPEFKLKNQKGKNVRLSSFEGRKVLLSFRPLAWTPV